MSRLTGREPLSSFRTARRHVPRIPSPSPRVVDPLQRCDIRSSRRRADALDTERRSEVPGPGSAGERGPVADTAVAVEVRVNFPALALDRVPQLARAAERAGFSALRVGDMQSTHREMYCALTLIS